MQTTKRGAMLTILENINEYKFNSIIISNDDVRYTIDKVTDDNGNKSHFLFKHASGKYVDTTMKDLKQFVIRGQAKILIME